jgi:DNA-binding NtrC family response regulator
MVKILIMDDEPALRNIVYNMLKPLGHSLFTAEDGRQAIETGHKEVPDMALLDMRVPDMDGLEVLAELRKINPNIKCIMLSGFGDVETAVNSIKLGAFDYVSKPFKIDEVLKVVNRAIEVLGGSSAKTTVAHRRRRRRQPPLPQNRRVRNHRGVSSVVWLRGPLFWRSALSWSCSRGEVLKSTPWHMRIRPGCA